MLSQRLYNLANFWFSTLAEAYDALADQEEMMQVVHERDLEESK
jgi:hypothetical protein